MLLGSPKSEVDRLLGKSLLARNILGLSGEKAWTYTQGDFEIIVGCLNDIARYCAIKRRKGPNTELSPAELDGALALNAPAGLWTKEIPKAPKPRANPPRRKPATEPHFTTYLSYIERDPKAKDRILREIRGWMPGGKPYAFFFLPAWEGQPPVLASEWGVNQALG